MNQIVREPVLDPSNWVVAHGDYLYQFAEARVRHQESAEELVQQTFLEALSARHSFNGNSSERTWLTAILKRKIADWLRKLVRQRELQEPRIDQSTDTLFTRFGAWKKKPDEWSSDYPGRELNRAEFRETLADCMDHLPARLRQVFILTYIDEESIDRIRRAVDVSAPNLAVMLHRARIRLWRCLTVNWFGEDPQAVLERR